MKKLAARFCSGLMVLAAAGLLPGCATNTSGALFPDPYILSQGQAKITFTDLAAVCTIEVYTLTGELVATINETDGDGQTVWDVKNDAGEVLSSGLYQYIIKSAADRQRGKILITK